MMRLSTVGVLIALFSLIVTPALADEGMWTFDHFPDARVRRTLGVDVDQAWLDHVRGASVRLNIGCSASVVTREGLTVTNHHCVQGCLQALSSPATDYLANGFTTASRSEERRCAGWQADVLTAITDITTQIRAATAGRTGAAFVQAREAALARAEQAGCGKDTRLHCEAVNLYHGGQFKLYRYHRYDDVRLVWAPEIEAAEFGGDPDNFNFPRFALDIGIVRLYEGGHPAQTPDFLHWNPAPPRDGEPTFVSGNPGSTQRQLTVAQLETRRDLMVPVGQLQRSELRGRLVQFASQGAEQRRIATDQLLDLENSFKSSYGEQIVLTDPATLTQLRTAEDAFRRQVAARPDLVARIGDPWADIDRAQTAARNQYLTYRALELGAGSYSQLFTYARDIVRGTHDAALPSDRRLPEYADSRLDDVRSTLFEAQPINPLLERIFLEHWLSKSREYLTADSPATHALLGRESPEGLAERLVSGTRLADPAFRQQLWNGGWAAVQASTDPLIQFVLHTDSGARDARHSWEEDVSGPETSAAERIAEARFAIFGDSVYPDATFTPRMSFGRVAGWTYRGVTVPATTTFAGLYARATGADPFRLSPRWLAAQSRVHPDTVYNFATDNDIVGGNSGSPVMNAHGDIIGLAFDGNIYSLGGDYFFDPAVNRSVVVSTAAITEALQVVYAQGSLVRELTTGAQP
jgi:hypothetical protein